MNLTNYINKNIQAVMTNGFTYVGLVIDADEDSITLIDKTGSKVCLRERAINFLKEVSNNGF